MRLLATVGIAAVMLLVLAPGASGHAAEVDVQTDRPAAHDAGSFEEAACIPTCEVLATPFGNAPPVTVVESNATVTWVTQVAFGHSATSDYPVEDKPGLLVDNQPTFREDVCMDVGTRADSPGSARLAIRDGQLAVLSEDQFDEPPSDQTWDVCEEAIGLEDGAFVLSYHCENHPRFQNSLLVVVPST